MRGWRERPRGEGRIGVSGVVMLVVLRRGEPRTGAEAGPVLFMVGILNINTKGCFSRS